MLDKNGFALSAIGSPIGKIKISDPFPPHVERFKRAIHLCKVFGTQNIRIFSYYPREGDGPVDWTKHRKAVLERMLEKCKLAEQAGVRLVHENENPIFGSSPARVAAC